MRHRNSPVPFLMLALCGFAFVMLGGTLIAYASNPSDARAGLVSAIAGLIVLGLAPIASRYR